MRRLPAHRGLSSTPLYAEPGIRRVAMATPTLRGDLFASGSIVLDMLVMVWHSVVVHKLRCNLDHIELKMLACEAHSGSWSCSRMQTL
jgi:hypothetical protein